MALAQKMRRIFQLPVADAPRLHLLGGEFEAATVEAAGGNQTVSVTGIGLDLWQAARSCVSEGVEFLSQLAPPGRDFITGPPDRTAHGLAPEVVAQLLALSGFDASRPAAALRWAEGRSVSGDVSILVPAALCYRNIRDRHDPEPRIKLSSGCGAALTREAALLHGLLELVERDAVALWWLGGLPGGLPPGGSEVPAELQDQLGREASTRVSWLLDITTDLGIPCVASFSTGADGRGLACGFAARLGYREAIRAAVFEMCQMEVGIYLILLKRQQDGDQALGDVDRKYLRRAFGFDVGRCALLFPSADRVREAGSRPGEAIAPVQALSARLESRGVDAFWVDLTRAELGFSSGRALAPALQSYPSNLVTPRLMRQIAETGGGFGLTSGIELM
ncbi:MAG TPA: YcaO-like family protein [Beijerinckiaceae bacterium]